MVHVVSKMRAPKMERAPKCDERKPTWKTIIGHKTTGGLLTLLDSHSQKLNKGNTIKKWIAKKESLLTLLDSHSQKTE